MKAIVRFSQKHSERLKIPTARQRAYWWAISLTALACGGSALAQTTNTPPAMPDSGSSTNITKLENVTVFGKLDEARNKIVDSLGATTYTISAEQIQAQAQGANAPFNEVILRMPGVSQDSFGQLHVRNEHAFLQYRINDVILPEGISGFGQELDTRFLSSVDLITGALPAQYGVRNAGIVDIHTKSGAFENGGDATIYGGSFDTYRPSIEYGGKEGNLNYYFNASYLHTGLGIENPTGSSNAIHDDSDQFKAFTYLSYVLDDTSRASLILSGSHAKFQVPNNPNQDPGTDGNGNPFPLGGITFDSASLNEKQTEQNHYVVAAYQKIWGDFNFQLAGYSRYSSVLFQPDPTGDLFFNGVASRVDRSSLTHGFQGDSSYDINDQHTLRGGFQVSATKAIVDSDTSVFGLDGAGNAVAPPFNVADASSKWGLLYGAYLQDEWKITPKWTVNFGGRVDVSHAFINESEFEPRINTIFKATEALTLHAGYARYFTPPPLESISQGTVSKFDNTSNAGTPGVGNDPVRSERSHYFDIGLTQKVTPELQLGLDGYYKLADQQLDEGQFGSALIQTPFNYQRGILYGVELTASYKKDGFSAYGNFSYSEEQAKNIDSAQFNFSTDDLNYIRDNYIYTDHNQTFTGSAGISYQYLNTLVYADMLYGNGLRAGQDVPSVPNGRKLSAYETVNLGVEQSFKVGRSRLHARFDVVNILDQTYELRDGSGVGVGAPQFGPRRGFFGSISYAF